MKSISLLAKRCFCILLIGSTILSCKKSEVPEKTISDFGNISYFANASGTAIQTFARRSIDSLISIDSSATVAVNWSSASVYVEKIAFVGKSNNLLDTTIAVGKNMDIFNADAFVGVVKLPAGSYKDVEVKLFCRKSMNSEMAFSFSGTFTNTIGGQDSVIVGSSYPFEASLAMTDIVINPSDNYKATFSFDLNRVLTGISTSMLESIAFRTYEDGKRRYGIWKGGSSDEPFYDQVIQNWQAVGSVIVTKE